MKIDDFVKENISRTIRYEEARYEIIGYAYHDDGNALCVLASANHIEKVRDFGFQAFWNDNGQQKLLENEQQNLLKKGDNLRKLTFSYESGYREALQTLDSRHGVIRLLGAPNFLITPFTPFTPKLTPSEPPRLARLYVGFDSEWQEYETENGATRKILSEQWSFRNAEGQMFVWFVFHLTDKRFPWAKVVEWLLTDCSCVLGISALPKKADIYLACFNGLADLSIFSDRKKIYKKANTIRNKLITMKRPIRISIYDKNKNVVSKLSITLRDCALLAPNKVALADLGNAMKIPKIDIPKEQKGQMESLMNCETEKFFCYAAQDAVITLRWIEYVLSTMEGKIPVTAASYGAMKIKKGIMKQLNLNSKGFEEYWCGISTEITSKLDDNGIPIKIKTAIPTARTILTAANECYLGGRNECFFFGFKDGIFYDYDLSSAYPNAMCLLEDIDFTANVSFFAGDLGEYQFEYTDYFYARIKFKFPEGTKYPCIPIRDRLGRGLIYPLEGECWAGAPEMKTALKMGASIYVFEGYTQPKIVGRKSLANIEKELITDRLRAKKEYGKGSPTELLMKEIANAGYGKMGQGLSGKRAFSSNAEDSVDIEPSPITASPQAALITGLVRAAVSEAMWKLHRLGFAIASVTTDGFLTNAPEEVMKEICGDGLLKILAENLRGVTGESLLFETKHACRGVFCMKTRGQIGFEALQGKKVPVAKAGYKPPYDQKEDRIFLIRQFLERTEAGLKSEYVQLPSARDCVLKGMDYIGKEVKKTTYWDFDYKRIPDESTIEEHEICIDGATYKHVFYDTIPWPSFNDFLERAESIRKRREPVKTKEDALETCNIIKYCTDFRRNEKRIRGRLDRNYAVSILRGIRQGKLVAPWIEGKKGSEICEIVEKAFDGKVKLTADDWKNAGRASLKALGLAGAEGYLEKLGLAWNLSEVLSVPAEEFGVENLRKDGIGK